MENFFKNLLKIIGAVTFARPIMAGLSAVVETFSLIVQINIAGIEKVAEKSRGQMIQHRWALLYSIMTIIGGTVFFFSLGATFHNRVLISIGGFIMISPLIVIAGFSEAVLRLVTLYLQTIEGVLKGFHAALLTILKKMGINEEDVLPEPELIQEGKVAKKFHSVWTALIPLSLVTIFCIFFPGWKSVGMVPVVLFILITQSIMVDQWADIEIDDIDLETDNRKIITTAKTKKTVFRLISLGLTVLLFWTAYSVMFEPSAKATEKDITEYVNKGSLIQLPVNLVNDFVVEPIKEYQAQRDSIAKHAKQKQKKDSTLTKEGRVVIFKEPWMQIPARGAVEFSLSPQLVKSTYKKDWRESRPVFMEVNKDAHPYGLINIYAKNKGDKRNGVVTIHQNYPTHEIRLYSKDAKYLIVKAEKTKEGILKVKIKTK